MLNLYQSYKNACVIALTETWLKEHDLGQDLGIDGFGQPIRLDRDAQLTGKIQKHVLNKKKIAFQKNDILKKKRDSKVGEE